MLMRNGGLNAECGMRNAVYIAVVLSVDNYALA